jgi:hypothetical protein
MLSPFMSILGGVTMAGFISGAVARVTVIRLLGLNAIPHVQSMRQSAAEYLPE